MLGSQPSPYCKMLTNLETQSIYRTLPIEVPMTLIEAIHARQILDSRGNPTVEAKFYSPMEVFRAAVPAEQAQGS